MAAAYVTRRSHSGAASVQPAKAARPLPTPAPAYPLRVGRTRRYLVDRHGRPFLIVGDSPQSLIANLSESQAEHCENELSPINRIGDETGTRFEAGEVTTAPGLREAYGNFVEGGGRPCRCRPNMAARVCLRPCNSWSTR